MNPRGGALLVVAPRYLLGTWKREFKFMFRNNPRAEIYVQHANFPSDLSSVGQIEGRGSHWIAVLTSP